jgi:hypothetical protein
MPQWTRHVVADLERFALFTLSKEPGSDGESILSALEEEEEEEEEEEQNLI